MSKAELFQTLQSLTVTELEEVARKVDELRASGEAPLTSDEEKLLERRLAEFRANPDPGDEWNVVMDRVTKTLTK
jgi:hypothetical protein